MGFFESSWSFMKSAWQGGKTLTGGTDYQLVKNPSDI